jgi:DNA-binding response OmpR family regulator
MRILVIDDDRSIAAAIRTLLTRAGYDVFVADGGRLGIQAFEMSRFDLTMVDIFMPGMDGLETIKAFRDRASSVPIIAMSGFSFRGSMGSAPDFLAMARALGATCCLRKPFRPQQLIASVESCLSPVARGRDAAANFIPRTAGMGG